MTTRFIGSLALVGLLLMANAAWAQRDPTLPPFPDRSTGERKQPTGDPQSRSWAVIVVDGQPHLVVGTRLYAVGQQFGQARIERISETEIWLRQGGILRKNSIYGGVIRRSAPDQTPCKADQSRSRHPMPNTDGDGCERK